MNQNKMIRVAGIDFDFSLESSSTTPLQLGLTVEHLPSQQGEPTRAETHLVRFEAQAKSGETFTLRDFSIKWTVPAIDMHGFYAGPPSPDELAKLPYWQFHKQSCANTGFPFFAFLHRNGENRWAFGLLDQLTETLLDGEMIEQTRAFNLHWHKPIGQASIDVSHWQETLFISADHRPWPEILREYVAAVDREWPQPRLPVPESAYDPVFCTWTAIHHAVSQEWVLRNARLAAELGFGTWLTDDGWFTDKAAFGDYRYTGDWEPCAATFPDFAGHVRAVRALGLRYVLWVAPFMVGDASQAAQKYAHLLSEGITSLRFSNLSPRRAETGEIVTTLLERLVRDYDLDGLKIDFLDSIRIDEPAAMNGDYQTVGEGVYDILSRAVDRIRTYKPEVLVEFRNTYANLASRRYANLYRASDVPINFALNRWQVSLLRLLVPDRAVHLDPALWHPQDDEANVAVHLINAISTVPMISVELDRYPQTHLDLIRYWIGFYRAHRDTLVHGHFAPELHLGHVPLIRFGGKGERIIGLYDDIAFPPGAGPLPLWILNASTRPFVELLPDSVSGVHAVRTRDRFGRVVSEKELQFPVSRLTVEVGGSLEIR